MGGVINVIEGAINFIFDVEWERDSNGQRADFWGGVYVAVILAVSALCAALSARRYRRLQL